MEVQGLSAREVLQEAASEDEEPFENPGSKQEEGRREAVPGPFLGV